MRSKPFTLSCARATFYDRDMSDKYDITFTVNGDKRTIRVEPRRSLADALREDCGLTGTHLGC